MTRTDQGQRTASSYNFPQQRQPLTLSPPISQTPTRNRACRIHLLCGCAVLVACVTVGAGSTFAARGTLVFSPATRFGNVDGTLAAPVLVMVTSMPHKHGQSERDRLRHFGDGIDANAGGGVNGATIVRSIGNPDRNVCAPKRRADDRRRHHKPATPPIHRQQSRYGNRRRPCGSFRGVELECEHVLWRGRIVRIQDDPAYHDVYQTDAVPVSGLTYTDGSAASGSTCQYVVTAVNAQGVESAYSPSATAAIPEAETPARKRT